MTRLATRRAKPAGSYHLTPENVSGFLSSIDIDQLHGFGYALRTKAESAYGTANLVKLGKIKKDLLIRTFGKKTGETIWDAARGIDHTELQSDKPRQSVSCDINVSLHIPSKFNV
jgi:DNA repair protein REV1